MHFCTNIAMHFCTNIVCTYQEFIAPWGSYGVRWMCEIMPSIYKKTTPARACRCPVIETDLSRCLYISTQRVSHPITRFIPREPRPYPPTNLLIPVDESENHEGIPFSNPVVRRECVSECAYGRLRFHLSCLESRVDRESCKMARWKTNITRDHRTKSAIYFAGFCVATVTKRFRWLRNIYTDLGLVTTWLKLRHYRHNCDVWFFRD